MALGAARLVVVISSADMTATRPAGRAIAIGEVNEAAKCKLHGMTDRPVPYSRD